MAASQTAPIGTENGNNVLINSINLIQITNTKKVIVSYKLVLSLGQTNPQLDALNLDLSAGWKIFKESNPILGKNEHTVIFTLVKTVA